MRSFLRSGLLAGLVIITAAACGFDCPIQGEDQHFDGCDALQAAYDAEQSRLDQTPNGAVLDDLLVCGAAKGCEVQP